MVDYSGHIDPTSTDALAHLSKLGGLLASAQQTVKDIEENLKEAKHVVSDLSENQIPELMDAVGLSRFTTREGVPFKLKESVHAYISKDRHAAAMRWLDENGHGQIMKRNVIVEFGVEQEESAQLLSQSLMGEYPGVVQKRTVHPSTLRAWAREQLEDGHDVPMELFGIHTRRVAQIG